MKIKPICSYQSPNYPDKENQINLSGLIKSIIPIRWQGRNHIVRIIAIINLLWIVRSQSADAQGIEKPVKSELKFTKESDSIKQIEKDTIKYAAPIFENGIGLGALGCIVIAPPVFMSEEEVRQTIEQEFSKNHIKFTHHNVEIDSIEYRYIKMKKPKKVLGNTAYEFEMDSTLTERKIFLDGYNEEMNLGYICISKDNYFGLGGYREAGRTVQWYNTKELANSIRGIVSEDRKINLVIFYDPLDEPGFSGLDKWDWDIPRDKLISDARNLLIKQVHDFIKWKKKEIGNR
jgi:hypothetical protein